jgi:DNA-binding transcriptional LysR family regulator
VRLLRPPVAADGLVVEVLRHEPLVALLPVTHPLATRINLKLTDLRDEPFIGYPSSSPSSVHLAVISACRQAGFSPHVRQEVGETSSLLALVAAGLGVALAPASVRHLRINGVTHRPLREPAQATVPLAVAYRKGPVSPLVRGYLETTRAVLRSQKQSSPGPTFRADGPLLPESI